MKTSIYTFKKMYIIDEALNWATLGPGTWASARGGDGHFHPGNWD